MSARDGSRGGDVDVLTARFDRRLDDRHLDVGAAAMAATCHRDGSEMVIDMRRK